MGRSRRRRLRSAWRRGERAAAPAPVNARVFGPRGSTDRPPGPSWVVIVRGADHGVRVVGRPLRQRCIIERQERRVFAEDRDEGEEHGRRRDPAASVREHGRAWPISEQGPLNASLCPRRWAIATAVLAALYATFVTSSGASLGTVEALALVALVSTAAGSYCYYVAATADPGLLRDEAAARKAYAAALEALARDGDAARRSPVVLAHNALAHQVPGGLAPAARRKSMVISASAPALGALAAASG